MLCLIFFYSKIYIHTWYMHLYRYNSSKIMSCICNSPMRYSLSYTVNMLSTDVQAVQKNHSINKSDIGSNMLLIHYSEPQIYMSPVASQITVCSTVQADIKENIKALHHLATRVGVNSIPELELQLNSNSNSGIGIGIEIGGIENGIGIENPGIGIGIGIENRNWIFCCYCSNY